MFKEYSIRQCQINDQLCSNLQECVSCTGTQSPDALMAHPQPMIDLVSELTRRPIAQETMIFHMFYCTRKRVPCAALVAMHSLVQLQAAVRTILLQSSESSFDGSKVCSIPPSMRLWFNLALVHHESCLVYAMGLARHARVASTAFTTWIAGTSR